MNRKDFKNWLPFRPNWHEVLRQYNIAGDYKHKQDLVALFFTEYKYIELKFISYYKEFEIIPNDVFNDLIFKFRQSFPKHSRIEGISYFDDLIELLLDKYTPIKGKAEKPAKTGFQSSLTDEQIDRLFELLKGSYINGNTTQSHFKAIFRPNPLPPDYLPIQRTKKFTGTLLAYLISALFQKENQSDYWHIAENCFYNAKNLKQSYNNAFQFNPDNKPKGYDDIDKILNTIYSHLQ